MNRRDCKARQHSDQMICPACGLVWDISDPDPPDCKKEQRPVESLDGDFLCPELQPVVE